MTRTQAGLQELPAIVLHEPFAIGLRPLDWRDWFVIGDDLGFYLAEKQRLEAAHGDKVFMAEPATEDAQSEVLSLIADHLVARYPDRYCGSGDGVEVVGANECASPSGARSVPLRRAAHLVPDDLAIMRRDETGWRLVAASLCFPSSWSLAEKFGKPLQQVHAPVPEFGEGTRNGSLIERIFDNLKPELPVWRQNWSIYPDAELHHPARQSKIDADAGEALGAAFLRRERQTLRKLPASGDILFTIRIVIDPLEAVAAMPGGPQALSRIRGQIDAMTPAQRAYKGLDGTNRRIAAALDTLSRA